MNSTELKTIWEENRGEFLKLYSLEQREKIAFAKLETAFNDLDGKQYYKFPPGMSLPLERMGHLQGYATWMASGIDGTEFDAIIATMDEILSNGLKKVETAAQMGAMIYNMKERRNMVFHTELLYNYAAVQLVREDEQPEVFNNEIHIEKVAMFKQMVAEGGTYFFFHQPSLQIPTAFLNLTQIEWEALWQESEAIQKNLKPILDLIRQGKKYTGKGKILTNKS
jgi:hypothetical protein